MWGRLWAATKTAPWRDFALPIAWVISGALLGAFTFLGFTGPNYDMERVSSFVATLLGATATIYALFLGSVLIVLQQISNSSPGTLGLVPLRSLWVLVSALVVLLIICGGFLLVLSHPSQGDQAMSSGGMLFLHLIAVWSAMALLYVTWHFKLMISFMHPETVLKLIARKVDRIVQDGLDETDPKEDDGLLPVDEVLQDHLALVVEITRHCLSQGANTILNTLPKVMARFHMAADYNIMGSWYLNQAAEELIIEFMASPRVVRKLTVFYDSMGDAMLDLADSFGRVLKHFQACNAIDSSIELLKAVPSGESGAFVIFILSKEGPQAPKVAAKMADTLSDIIKYSQDKEAVAYAMAATANLHKWCKLDSNLQRAFSEDKSLRDSLEKLVAVLEPLVPPKLEQKWRLDTQITG